MRFKRKSSLIILAVLLLWALPAVALAQVSVYAEGAYTGTDLVVNIYADITGNPLCSYGVTLSYDADRITVATATKNEDVWYFGTTSAKQPYMNPDTSTSEQIIFIGGKLDTDDPTEGVIGSRVLLGTATFNRKAGQDTVFGIGLSIGKTHPPFDNFVTTSKVVLDGSVTYGSAAIFERGDANGDGSINSTDYVAIRNLLTSTSPPVYADCNGDGLVNSTDYVCVRNKLPH